MSASEYQSIVQDTILASSVQAIEIPIQYGIESRVLEGPKLKASDFNGRRFLHNAGQLQTLAGYQVESARKILLDLK